MPSPGLPYSLDWRSCWLSCLEGNGGDHTDINYLDDNSSPLPFSGEVEVISDQDSLKEVVRKAPGSVSLL